MRLFLAAPVPPDLRQDLARFADETRQRLPPARWVQESRIHLTLVFLGEVEPRAVDQLSTGISAVTHGASPFRLEITNPGAFPPQRPARVAWIGLTDNGDLASLQATLQGACSHALSRDRDDRPFHPHLTLARCKRPWGRKAVARWTATPLPVTGRGFEVTYVDLMQSQLTPSGPLYKSLQCFPLGG